MGVVVFVLIGERMRWVPIEQESAMNSIAS